MVYGIKKPTRYRHVKNIKYVRKGTSKNSEISTSTLRFLFPVCIMMQGKETKTKRVCESKGSWTSSPPDTWHLTIRQWAKSQKTAPFSCVFSRHSYKLICI